MTTVPLVASLLDLAIPQRCWGCGSAGPLAGGTGLFCEGCDGRVRPLAGSDCIRCGILLGGSRRPRVCGGCGGFRPYRRAVAWAAYEGPVREALHALKFSGADGIAPRVARPLAERLATEPFSRRLDAVTAVPPAGLAWLRAVHPAERVGRIVARALGVAWRPGLLRRARRGRPQRDLTVPERWRNVEGAYEAHAAAGFRVLVVDDVMTTGATAHACARALRDSGARAVWIAAVARS